jgi:hypothetical protein
MRFAVVVVVVAAVWACNGPPSGPPAPAFPTQREPCADREPLRKALFGDLHVHTGFSFDAAAYDNILTPADAYRFARGESVGLAPLDAAGSPTRTAQLDRPLDFVGVTDHGEFLGEVYQCTTPGSESYDTPTCRLYRDPIENGALLFGVKMSVPASPRFADICGTGDSPCLTSARERWLDMQRHAEAAYDRTAACEFTSFVAYEYTNTAGVSNLHRNVVFRNSIVPELPVTMFEAPDPLDLWLGLDELCVQAGTGCDVVVLPHNSNLSNGNLFYVSYPRADTIEEERAFAKLRARMEPVVEVFQHKGDSECRSGFSTDDHEPDPLCEFEKLRPVGFDDCGLDPGSGGMRLDGCLHYLDFVRNALKEGLREQARIGVNPYRLGFIGSTDTHNGTPGNVASADFPGHIGRVDATPAERLGVGNVTHDGIINNPGGLAAVWAEENSRDAIFDALRRRETFATSGPRMTVRLFGGWDFGAAECALPHDDMVRAGYDRGVPMGGELTDLPAGAAPAFLVHAARDAIPIERVQIVKGWYTADGRMRERVYDVALSGATPAPAVDPDTCEPSGAGLAEPCVAWTDPDFDPSEAAFYYARIVENPTCRWSARECLALAPADRPPGCDDPSIPDVVQQRAWSSPIWYAP